MTSTARSNSSNSNSRPPARTLAPNKTLELGGGLSLTPRLKLLLTFFRSDHSVRPVDEWRLKSALLDFLRDGPLALSVPDEDLVLRRRSDLSKRKRDEPVASGVLFVRDFGFRGKSRDGDHGEESERKRYVEWRERVVGRLDGMEVNVEGVGFRLSVELPQADDYERLKESWEEFYASRSLGNNRFSRGATVRPDTIVVKGLPSRWFAEPRVSSKPSMLVTHTIFSALGKIRLLSSWSFTLFSAPVLYFSQHCRSSVGTISAFVPCYVRQVLMVYSFNCIHMRQMGASSEAQFIFTDLLHCVFSELHLLYRHHLLLIYLGPSLMDDLLSRQAPKFHGSCIVSSNRSSVNVCAALSTYSSGVLLL